MSSKMEGGNGEVIVLKYTLEVFQSVFSDSCVLDSLDKGKLT